MNNDEKILTALETVMDRLGILEGVVIRLDAIEANQAAMQLELRNIKEELRDTKAEVRDAKAEMRDMKTDLGDLKKGQDEMRIELNEVKKGQDEMRIELNEVKTELSEVKEDGQITRDIVTRMEIDHEEKIGILFDSHDLHKVALDNVRADIAKVDGKCELLIHAVEEHNNIIIPRQRLA